MIEELKIIISAEVTKAKKAVDDAKKQIKSFKDQVKQASADVDKNFEKMGAGMAAGAKAAGTALVAVGAALLALGASTQEYRNEQAKLITAFEAAGGSATEAKETYNDLYRVLGDGGQAVEAANHLAKLTTEEKALNEWTTICQGAYATFGASLPIEAPAIFTTLISGIYVSSFPTYALTLSRMNTIPPLEPGTAPFTAIRPFSASILMISRLRTVTCSLPY